MFTILQYLMIGKNWYDSKNLKNVWTILLFCCSLKYHDLSHIHTQDFIDKQTLSGKSCDNNADCAFNLCQSKCDSDRKQCLYKQLNNNLQIVCEKVGKVSIFYQ